MGFFFTTILNLLTIPLGLSCRVPCVDYSNSSLTQFNDCSLLNSLGDSSTCLNLSNNNLRNLPGNLATCSSGLTQIDISFNNFTQFPYRSVAGLHHLHYLRADGNQVRSLQDGWRPLSNLTTTSLVNNSLQNIPSNLLEIFPDLKEGNFSENNVTDVPLFTRLCHNRSNDVNVYLMDNPLKNLNLKYFVEDECVTCVTVNDSKMVIHAETPYAPRTVNVHIFHNSKTVNCDQNISAHHLSMLEANVTCVHPNGTRGRLETNTSTSSTTSPSTAGGADDSGKTTTQSSSLDAYSTNVHLHRAVAAISSIIAVILAVVVIKYCIRRAHR